MTRTDSEILNLFVTAFAGAPRPEHFTNYAHCCECAEHDAVLMDRDRATLAIEDVGGQGWNPITMATPQAFAYYLPALARLALDPVPDAWDWYGYIILFELRRDGPRNDRWLHCTSPQRRAVVALIEHLFETRAAEIELYNCGHELLETVAIWSNQS